MEIGLFFGSFNPVHTGHMIIANHVANWSGLDEVWMIVTPQNPLKERSNLAKDYDRLHMVQLAIGDNPKLRASNIEFSLPKPSYTVDTLIYLKEKYPVHEFTLIMGGDNLQNLHKWKNYNVLLENYKILVYKRPEYLENQYQDRKNISLVEAPLMEISSTFIRKSLKKGKSVRYLVPDPVWAFLENSTLYRS
ncbi:nicotinate (nicotinamide) nucleotide adenylyltransferase [Membranihabitans maritimus]|uniref:nicotinate (nicotinamide) nucleotide adenylyltransferase n=1 Tax=Membranihabitans maritimus TaxID=2904244 RepID=UPI001F22247D|nr:nicotinate (nicotinamide) nucleotide adenylyltransferase [Membranihabitans maritimus]